MPENPSVDVEMEFDHDAEPQILLNTEPKPSLNAWKHGAYSNLGLLPGEDRGEYARFLEEVFLEWAPSGPTETDTVVSLANCLWRKSRLWIYAKAANARRCYFLVFQGRESLLWDLDDAQRGAAGQFAMVHFHHRGRQRVLDEMTTPYVLEMLKWAESRQNGDKKSEEKSDKKGEEKNDKKSKERSAGNTAKESEGNRNQNSEEKSKDKSGKTSEVKSEEETKRSDAELLEMAKLGDQMTPETLLEEIKLGDRIDARIDRLVKRLLHLKAAKQMI